MKNILSMVAAGVIGGVAALGGAALFNPINTETIHISASADTQAFQNTTTPIATPKFANTSDLGMTGEVPTSFADAAERTMPAVVNITSISEQKPRNMRDYRYYQLFGAPKPSQSTGSGVIISEEGYIVTNNHVINDATRVEVTLYDNRKFDATVVGKDPSTDLAVLKIDGERLPILEMADSDASRVGEWVLAVGNPFQLTSTVTAGIISAKGRDISILNGQQSIESFIQTDAAVNPGNSGGALVNTKGELLGINTAIFAPTGTYAGYSFAVPINLVKKVVKDLIDYGEVKRAFLGITIYEVNSEVAEQMDLSVTSGVYITDVMPESGAEAAGIQKGDVIVSVNNIATKTVSELQEQIGSRNPGDEVRLTVVRNGMEKVVAVSLKD